MDSYANPDLFVARPNQGSLQHVTYANQPFPSNAVWTSPVISPVGNSSGSVSLANTDALLYLFRYLHFQNQLIDQVTGTIAQVSSRKLVIVIHGWNSLSKDDQYSTPEFSALTRALRSALTNTDWRLLLYRWETDADTGLIDESLFGKIGLLLSGGTAEIRDATEAATINHLHGQHLGELLSRGLPNLEKVHLIAHSAGAWGARSAARYILQNSPNCAVQVTLLDPYIPGALITGSVLTTPVMSGFSSVSGNQQLRILENYFANELFAAPGTQEFFAWRARDLNQYVNWSGGVLGPDFYASHSGPIQFYADTVNATLPNQSPAAGLANFDVRPTSSVRIGWTRGLFYNEPLIQQNPQNQTAVVGAAVTLSSTASSRNISGASDAAVTYQWKRNGTSISGATSATLPINSVQLSDAGDYTVTVSNAWGATTSSAATLVVSGSVPIIIAQPQSQTLNAGQSATLSVTASGLPAPTYQWRKGGTIVGGATAATLTLNNVQPTDAGSYVVFVSNSVGSVLSSPVTLTVNVPPTIIGQSANRTLAMGASTTFNVLADGAETLRYQWRKDGVPVAGATNATFTINNVKPVDAGSYSVVVSNVAGSVTSAATVLAVNYSRLVNLSILTAVTPSTPFFTIGTVIGGAGTSGPKPLLVRAAGPSLTQFGVTSTLSDPKLDVFSAQTVLATNDNWGGTAALNSAFAQVGAFTYSSAGSTDAAVYDAAMPAGSYTVQISGVGGATGTAIAELYDAAPETAITAATPRLVNVSVLKQVNAGEILTAGFVISGTAAKQVLIRVVGPTLALAPFNVPGVMADPKLDLFRGQTVIDSNDNWGGGPALTAAFSNVGAFALGATSRDAALLVTLPPGNYTAQASGADGASGVTLVEIYEIP